MSYQVSVLFLLDHGAKPDKLKHVCVASANRLGLVPASSATVQSGGLCVTFMTRITWPGSIWKVLART
jgi:hypothetical protein